MTRRIEIDDEQDVSLLAEDQYFRMVRWMPDLTAEEEQALLECVDRGKVERCKACPDAAVVEEARRARDRLVETHLRFVVHMVQRCAWRFHGMELLDLIQEGNIGLLRAIEYNDASKGYRLSTIAGRFIRQALWHALHEQDGLIRVSKRVYDTLSRARHVERELRRTLGREPLLEEVAHAMGMPAERLQEYHDFPEQARAISLQVLLREATEDGEDEDHLDFVELYASWVRVEQHQTTQREQVLRCAIEGILTEPQRQVIYLRYGLVEGEECVRSLTETGAVLGQSDRKVGYIEQVAKRRLVGVLKSIFDGQEDAVA